MATEYALVYLFRFINLLLAILRYSMKLIIVKMSSPLIQKQEFTLYEQFFERIFHTVLTILIIRIGRKKNPLESKATEKPLV